MERRTAATKTTPSGLTYEERAHIRLHWKMYACRAVRTPDHGEWGLCVVARTRPNLGRRARRELRMAPPYNQHFLLPDALHSTSSDRWHRPLTPFSAPTFPILRAKTCRKWEDAFTLNARSAKDYLFTQTWHGRGLHAEMQQLKVCTLLHLMQRGGRGVRSNPFTRTKASFPLSGLPS